MQDSKTMASSPADVARSTPATAAEPRTGSGVRRFGLAFACIFSGLLGILAFLPSLKNGFVYDDHAIILDNPAVHPGVPEVAPVSWPRAWLTPFWPRHLSPDKLYRPLSTISLRASTALSGGEPQPAVFRALNLLLHGLTCVAVALLAGRWSGRVWAALAAGVLYAAHPVHTEAVVTGYGRAEVLAGCCAAWVMALHLGFWPRASAGLMPLGRRVACWLLFAAAVMSKEHAVLVWPVLMLADVIQRLWTSAEQRMTFRVWFNTRFAPMHLGYAAGLILFLVLRFTVFGWQWRLEPSRVSWWESPLDHSGSMAHLLTPLRLVWLTASILVDPQRLCPIWSVTALSPAKRMDLDVQMGLILLVALAILAVILWKLRSPTLILLAGTLITLSLAVHAIPAAHWIYAERWLYLPTIPLAVLLGWGLGRLGRLGAAAALAAAIVLLPACWVYGAAFASDLSLNREVVARQSDNFQGRKNLAVVLYSLSRPAEAVQASREVLERFGEVDDAWWVLARSYLELGDGRAAMHAIDRYESLRREIPGPGLVEERARAQALIDLASRAAASQPAAAPAEPGLIRPSTRDHP